MRNNRRKYLVVIILVLIAAGVGGILMYKGLKERKQRTEGVVYTRNPDLLQGIVTWKGQQYRYNDHLSNYLFIGVDEYELVDTQAGERKAGQSDALFLLSYDRMTGNAVMISIPRDTMTEIEVFLQDGSSAGMSKDHISLAYSFGDGKHGSCQLVRNAVSQLFYDLPVSGYCALSMSGLSVIPEVIGSFEVIVPNDSLKEKQESYTKGSEVTITGENAELFVRYRDVKTAQSALERTERQQAFLKAALEKAEEQYEKDAGIVTQLYEKLKPYLVTSMSNDLFLELMESVYQGGEVASWTIPGEGIEGAQYDEYHVDDKMLYEKVMETFYIRVE